jgi:alanyl-tRNA synthetase
MTKEEYLEADDAQKVVEIWNDVFMEYLKKEDKVIGKLESKNVDTGSGFERVCTVLQGKRSVFETDLFEPIISKISSLAKNENQKSVRIIADHIRTATFLIADGVVPSNTDRGYILRRLLRRAIRHAGLLGIEQLKMAQISEEVVSQYKDIYPNIFEQKSFIFEEINKEEERFRKTLDQGLKEFNWMTRTLVDGAVVKKELPSTVAFELFTTYGFPFELIEEEAKGRGMTVDKQQFENRMEEHRIQSRKGSEQKFKGGLGAGVEGGGEEQEEPNAHRVLSKQEGQPP